MQYGVEFSDVPRLKQVAAHLVKNCLRVKPGELATVAGGVHQYPLLAAVSVEICKAGGHPLLQVYDDGSTLARINEVPKQYLGLKHKALRKLEDEIDVRLVIHPAYDPGNDKKKDPKRVALINERDTDREKQRKARLLVMGWPTPANAAVYGLDFQAFQQLFWEAFWADLDTMSAQAAKIKAMLQGAREVIITSADESQLRLAIGSRPLWVDTGCFSDELVAAGDLTKNMPCGEVYCSPIEKSANGTIFFQQVFCQGEWIRGLKLKFCDGVLADIEAAEGKKLFEQKLSQHKGDKDKVGELGIGLNPRVPHPIGNTLLDEKVIGSIHLALGHNTMYGGTNKSSLHWDLVCMNPTVVADGQSVMEQGIMDRKTQVAL